MRVVTLCFLACATLCGSVRDADAVVLEGVNVPDGSLTALLFPKLKEKLKVAFPAVQGSVLAYACGRLQDLTKEMEKEFPKTPQSRIDERMEKLFRMEGSQEGEASSDSESWYGLLVDQANSARCSKKIQGWKETIELLLGLPKKLVEIFSKVEEFPEAFEFPADNEIPQNLYENDYSFPIKSDQHWEIAHSKEMVFFRKHAAQCAFVGIERYSTKNSIVSSSVLTDVFDAMGLKSDNCREIVQTIFQRQLQTRYNEDDYSNSWIVTKKLLFPILDALRELKKDALEKEKEKKEKEAAAS